MRPKPAALASVWCACTCGRSLPAVRRPRRGRSRRGSRVLASMARARRATLAGPQSGGVRPVRSLFPPGARGGRGVPPSGDLGPWASAALVSGRVGAALAAARAWIWARAAACWRPLDTWLVLRLRRLFRGPKYGAGGGLEVAFSHLGTPPNSLFGVDRHWARHPLVWAVMCGERGSCWLEVSHVAWGIWPSLARFRPMSGGEPAPPNSELETRRPSSESDPRVPFVGPVSSQSDFGPAVDGLPKNGLPTESELSPQTPNINCDVGASLQSRFRGSLREFGNYGEIVPDRAFRTIARQVPQGRCAGGLREL